MKWRAHLASCVFLLLPLTSGAAGELLATGGLTPVDGGAGGGLLPWAVIAGYGSEQEFGGSLSLASLDTGDYQLRVLGAAVGWSNRFELSVATQTFDMPTLTSNLGLAPGTELRMNSVGAKVRLFGDLIYGNLPQLSAGAYYKRSLTPSIPLSVGAEDRDSLDFFVSATRLWLDGPAGRRLLLNATARRTESNQGGLLGFGSSTAGSPEWVFEGSAALFLDEDVAVGAEYRQMTNNLAFAQSDDWRDIFVAYVPNKRVSLAAAWVDLGSVAGIQNQQGFYLSVQGSF
ncbi:MAG: DUF3034 family protein [Pseudomonadota bacterium]